MALQDTELALLKLAARSETDADGWTKVSATVWPHVERHAVAALIELRVENGQGFARLTDKGRTIVEYL